MTVSLHMIEDCVGDAFLCRIPDEAPMWFAHVIGKEDSERATFGAVCEFSSDTLFVGDATACAAHLEQHRSDWALCAQQEEKLPSALVACGERVIILQTDHDANFVAAAATCKLLDISEWIVHMQRTLLEGGDYQDLIDLSENVIGNSLTMSDYGFRIVAHTRNMLPSDPLIRESIANGMFDNKALATFRKNERPLRWNTRTGIHLLEVSESGPVVECIFRIKGIYSAHLVMHCEWRPLSDGLLDELSLLAECIELHLKHELSTGRLFDQGTARMLVDLIDGSPVPHRSLDAWLHASGLSCEGSFELAVVDYGYRDEERQLAVYAGLRLIELFPDAIVALEGNRIALLRQRHAAGKDAAFHVALESHARSYHGRVGLSDRFHNIKDVKFAYKQSIVALTMATLDKRSAIDAVDLPKDGDKDKETDQEGDIRLFPFGDYLVPYLLVAEQRDEDLISYCIEHDVPARIRDADRAAGTQNYSLLFVYLASDRRPSIAAERLHIHRNTLLYRIRRIEQEYGIDLDQWRVRERLLAEYQILRFGD